MFRGLIQSTIYLPHFVSWVIMYSLLFALFSHGTSEKSGEIVHAAPLGEDDSVFDFEILERKDNAIHGYIAELLVFRALLVAGALLLIGGGVWYVAITGIIGIKKWDFGKYGSQENICIFGCFC